MYAVTIFFFTFPISKELHIFLKRKRQKFGQKLSKIVKGQKFDFFV